jgi:hypothetical protein
MATKKKVLDRLDRLMYQKDVISNLLHRGHREQLEEAAARVVRRNRKLGTGALRATVARVILLGAGDEWEKIARAHAVCVKLGLSK